MCTVNATHTQTLTHTRLHARIMSLQMQTDVRVVCTSDALAVGWFQSPKITCFAQRVERYNRKPRSLRPSAQNHSACVYVCVCVRFLIEIVDYRPSVCASARVPENARAHLCSALHSYIFIKQLTFRTLRGSQRAAASRRTELGHTIND